MIPKKNLHDFFTSLKEYEITLTKIIPLCLKQGDEEIDMEIIHLLTCRDELQSDIELFSDEPQIVAHIAKIHELDGKLASQKKIIFSHNADYRGWRKRNKIPKSHWWWYMDEGKNRDSF